MDVRCEKCGTEYELDEGKLKASGVTVKCTSCGHMFKVRRKSARGGASGGGGALRTWLVKMEDGEIRACYELSTLQQWISAGQVTPDCRISRTGKKWKRLGDIAELAAFFAKAPGGGTEKSQVTHPRTIRRDGASKTARLPKPNTGAHSVPGKPVPKRTLVGAPSPVLMGHDPAKLGSEEETKPLSESEQAQVQAAMNSPLGDEQATVEEHTLELPTSDLEEQSPVDDLPKLSESEEETTEILESPVSAGEEEPVTQDLSETQDLHTSDLERPRPPSVAPMAAEVPDTDMPTEVYEPDEPKTGAWASGPKPAAEARGPSGPVGGLGKQLPKGDAAFVSSKLSAPEEIDEHEPERRSSGAGKWIAVGSLAVLGAAAGGIFFLLDQGEKEIAASTPDAAQPTAAQMFDAAPPPTPDPPKIDEEPWKVAVDAAEKAINADVAAGFEEAGKALAGLEDERLEVLYAQGRILAAKAQKELDAGALLKGAAARRQSAKARKLAAQASAVAKKARAVAAQDAKVLALTADVLRLQGKSTREIERWMRKARAGDGKKDRYVRYVDAMVLLRNGKKAPARKILESLVDDSLADTRPRYRLALIDFSVSAFDEAKTGAEAVLALAPEHEGASKLVERVAEKTKVSEADPLPPQDSSTGAVTRPPTGGSYEQLLGRADRAAERGKCASAVSLYKAALDKNPAGVAALTGLGYCHLDKRQFAQAQAKFRAALGVSPRYQAALFGVAEAYQQQGLKSRAVKAYKNYLRIHPSGGRAASAKRQIERLGGAEKPGGKTETGKGTDSGTGTDSGKTETGTGTDSGKTETGTGTDAGKTETGTDSGKTETGTDSGKTETGTDSGKTETGTDSGKTGTDPAPGGDKTPPKDEAGGSGAETKPPPSPPPAPKPDEGGAPPPASDTP